MAAILNWGKGFKIVETTSALGEPYQSVVGVDGDLESITWSSVEEMQSLAENHGVSRDIWPVYPDCDMESDVPLEDALQRSATLRMNLERVNPRVVEESYWLNFIWKLLRDGNAFFIKR